MMACQWFVVRCEVLVAVLAWVCCGGIKRRVGQSCREAFSGRAREQ